MGSEEQDWRSLHRQVESEFLQFHQGNLKAVLKGGTALMLCYGLNRFSEDLDLDALSKSFNLTKAVKEFCRSHGYDYFEKKHTDTVQRCTIHYGGLKPLKIETSYRRNNISQNEIETVNGMLTYKIEPLAMMKLNAYLNRDKIRDLFDVCFIINDHWDELSPVAQNMFRYALAEKGLEQFDAAIAEQTDELIDPDLLAERFLNAYEIIDPHRPTHSSKLDSASASQKLLSKLQEYVHGQISGEGTLPCPMGTFEDCAAEVRKLAGDAREAGKETIAKLDKLEGRWKAAGLTRSTGNQEREVAKVEGR